MKSTSLLTLCLMALGLVVHAEDAPKITLPGSAPAAAAPAFTEAQLLEEFGWFIGKRVGLTELEFTKAEVDGLVKGLTNAAAGKESPYELEKIGPAMDEFMQKKQAAYLSKLKVKNDATNTAYFAKLKENKNVVELPSGLRYEIIQPGTMPGPKPEDTFTAHYTGKLLDGSTFDSSAGREPLTLPLTQVIPGWTEGLQKIGKGGKIKLHVPSALAYG
ncbi:MAG: FKBP-type peptidyl-prolyl cis-trans isomerase, partial [Opitutaceae bacterium]